MNIGRLIGNTPMIKTNYEFEGKEGSIYSKLEYYNYSGSIKDRIALYIIQKEREAQKKIEKEYFKPCIIADKWEVSLAFYSFNRQGSSKRSSKEASPLKIRFTPLGKLLITNSSFMF